MIPSSPGYGKVRSFAGTPLAGTVNAGVCVTAAIATVACWVSWAVTFTAWAQHLPSALFVPFFALMFPLFGWSVWLQTTARRPAGARRASADWMNAIPRVGRVLVALAVAAAVAGWSTAASALGGQPEYDPATHRYALDNHGNLAPVSKAAYLHALAVQNRLFPGVTLVFLTVAFGVTYGQWSRHRPGIRALRNVCTVSFMSMQTDRRTDSQRISRRIARRECDFRREAHAQIDLLAPHRAATLAIGESAIPAGMCA